MAKVIIFPNFYNNKNNNNKGTFASETICLFWLEM